MIAFMEIRERSGVERELVWFDITVAGCGNHGIFRMTGVFQVDGAMDEDWEAEFGELEGQVFTIGREGQIRIADPTLSRGHAELRFVDGKIRLRDLGSTNGTFMISENSVVAVSETFVTPDQKVVIGSKIYTVKALLAMAGVFASYSDDVGLLVRVPGTDRTLVKKADLDEVVSQTIARMFD